MERNYGLANTEMEIMELLWSVKEPLPFRELIRYANEEWNKTDLKYVFKSLTENGAGGHR